jgi:hypothetical protein
VKVRIPTIEPRDYQLPFLKAFDAGTQYSVISWHRRAGKDVTSFNALMKRAIQTAGNYYQSVGAACIVGQHLRMGGG